MTPCFKTKQNKTETKKEQNIDLPIA